MIKKLLASAIVVLLFASCAAVKKQQEKERRRKLYQKISITADQPVTVIVDSDTIDIQGHSRKSIELPRSSKDKSITVIRDSTIQEALLPAKKNRFAVDIDWKYPTKIYLTHDGINGETAIRFYDKFKYTKKDVVNLRIGVPWVNLFNFDYEADGKKTRKGFMGISLGVDYFYADNSFVNISGVAIMDAFTPVPAPVDYEGIHDHMSSVYGTISNNHMFAGRRLSIGYGISYGNDTWNTINHGMYADDVPAEIAEQESIMRNSDSFGLVFPFYYYTKKSFYIGLIYRPMILQFADRTRWKYQHTISFEFGWRIRLAK